MAAEQARSTATTRIDESQFLVGELASYGAIVPPPVNGLVSAIPGLALVSVGASSGYVTVAVDVLDQPPAGLDNGWDEIVELDLDAQQGNVIVMALMEDPPELPPLTPAGPGLYRLRVHAAGRDLDYDTVAPEPIEKYLIQSWPSHTPQAEIIHRQSDQTGANLRLQSNLTARRSTISRRS